MNSLYKRIKSRREELGFSQEDLATKLGYKSRSTIAKIESGENDIPQSKIESFAKALSTTPAYLMGWNDGEYVKVKLSKNLADIIQKTVFGYLSEFKAYIFDTCNKLDLNAKFKDNYYTNKSLELYTSLLNSFNGENYNDWLFSCTEEIKKYENSVTAVIIRNEINKIVYDKISEIIYFRFSNIIENIYNEINDIVIPDTLTVEHLKYLDSDDNKSLLKSINDIIENNETMLQLNMKLYNAIESELYYDILADVLTNIAKQLNSTAQEKILDYAKDLLNNERYAKITPLSKKEETLDYLLPDAASEIKGASEEDKQHDDDGIMNDPNF